MKVAAEKGKYKTSISCLGLVLTNSYTDVLSRMPFSDWSRFSLSIVGFQCHATSK